MKLLEICIHIISSLMISEQEWNKIVSIQNFSVSVHILISTRLFISLHN